MPPLPPVIRAPDALSPTCSTSPLPPARATGFARSQVRAAQLPPSLRFLAQLPLPSAKSTVDTCAAHHFIHGCCDASSRAYADAIYLRMEIEEGLISVRLLTAKSKITSITTVSIKNLELYGVILLIKLIRYL
jgi:hypothetical protein